MYGYYWRFDPTYLLIIIGMLLSLQITMTREAKPSGFQRIYMEKLLWQQWE